jgi:alanine dehydrogenase
VIEARPEPGNTAYWVSEHDVVSVLDLADAVDALRAGFVQQGEEQAAELEKTMLGYGDHATLHALGAALTGVDLAGAKTWTHTPGGADPVLCMFDTRTGRLVALIEAFALGQLRTAGTAALATDLLAAPGASVLAVIGTGKQALPQVAAVAQVRPVAGVRAYSRSSEHREAFATKVVDTLGLPCVASPSVEDAVDGAEVVTLVTRATEPVLLDEMVTPGMHVNAVGAIDLERREFEPAILSRCAAVVTDSLPQAQRHSSELREHFDTGFGGAGPWKAVLPLSAVVARGVTRQPGDVTLFKGMGSGIEDVALGAAVLRRLGIGAHAGAADGLDGSEKGEPASVTVVRRRGRAEVPLHPRVGVEDR